MFPVESLKVNIVHRFCATRVKFPLHSRVMQLCISITNLIQLPNGSNSMKKPIDLLQLCNLKLRKLPVGHVEVHILVDAP